MDGERVDSERGPRFTAHSSTTDESFSNDSSNRQAQDGQNRSAGAFNEEGRSQHDPHTTSDDMDADAGESLLGFAMARSTPRFLIYSRFSTFLMRAFEVLFALHALAMLIILFMLHVRFVKKDGCSDVLMPVVDNLRGLPAWSENAIVDLRLASSTYRFARERGFLLLSERALNRIRQNHSVQTIEVGHAHPCLGPPFSRWVLKHIIGYDTVAANAFARLRKAIGGPGYFLSLSSRRLINLGYSDNDANGVKVSRPTSSPALAKLTSFGLKLVWKAGAVLTATFIMGTTGLLVNFALRAAQVHLIKLSDDLQYVMREQIPYSGVIVQHTLEGLVFVPIVAGVLFFLFEFFDDQILAFLVMITAGMSRFALILSTRHWVSRKCLPRLFLGYFLGFHTYFFSFPLGFSWCALATAMAFMWHASLVVWNRYELPMMRQEQRSTDEW